MIFSKLRKSSSRSQIQIKEVMDDVLVLPNKEFRQIIETSSVNFELKSEEEQDVIIDGFQNFLNSLPCQIQILVRVREIDIDKYIEDISKLTQTEKVPVYKKQINGYCSFVRKLVSGNKILSRRFYIIIPYKHTGSNSDWKLVKEHLSLQREIISRGLERMQIKTKTLNSIEILNLFYSTYNGDSLKTQPLTKESLSAMLSHTYV